MARFIAIIFAGAALFQDGGDFEAERKQLDAQFATAAEATGEALLKIKAFDEARALIDFVKTKSDANQDNFEKFLAKAKGTTKDPWGKDAVAKIKEFGKEQAKKFYALARKWKDKEAEKVRWVDTEGEILDDIIEYCSSSHKLNVVRAQVSLPAAAFDWKLSVPCVWHARYIILNPNERDEKEGKPGFTSEGKAAESNSVTNRSKSISILLEELLHGPLDVNYLVRPALSRIGLGYSKATDIAAVIDIESGIENSLDLGKVIMYPPDKSTEVPTKGEESSIQLVSGKPPQDCGYPISLIFFDPNSRVREVKVRFVEGRDKDIPYYLSTPENPALPDKYPNNKNTVIIVPKSPLKPTTSHGVTVEYSEKGEQKRVSWTFSTRR